MNDKCQLCGGYCGLVPGCCAAETKPLAAEALRYQQERDSMQEVAKTNARRFCEVQDTLRKLEELLREQSFSIFYSKHEGLYSVLLHNRRCTAKDLPAAIAAAWEEQTKDNPMAKCKYCEAEPRRDAHPANVSIPTRWLCGSWEKHRTPECYERQLEQLQAKCERLRGLLDWYGEKAAALHRYLEANQTQTNCVEAVMIELKLDAGKRAAQALKERTMTCPRCHAELPDDGICRECEHCDEENCYCGGCDYPDDLD